MLKEQIVEGVKIPDFTGRRVVVVGGTGDVGEGIVRAWLKTNATVIVPSRSESRVQEFKTVLSDIDELDNIEFVVDDYNNFDSADTLATRISNEYGLITDIVVAMGSWWQGELLCEIKEDTWYRYFVDISTAQVAMFRAWADKLPSYGSYQLIIGGSAIEPVRGSAVVCMQQSALLMMRKAISLEKNGRFRVASQVLGPIITRSREKYGFDWISNLEVGFVSVGIANEKALEDGDFYSRNAEEMYDTMKSLNLI